MKVLRGALSPHFDWLEGNARCIESAAGRRPGPTARAEISMGVEVPPGGNGVLRTSELDNTEIMEVGSSEVGHKYGRHCVFCVSCLKFQAWSG